jgi:putative acetyltransferase
MDIKIRAAEPGDYEAIQKIFTGPKVIRGTLQLPYPSIETWRKRLETTADGSYSLVACVGDELAGRLDIHMFPHKARRRHAAQIGMSVRDDFQGQGVGTALMLAALDLADNWLNILRVELEVFTDNEPAVRLYKKCGFVIEGTLARYAYREGKYVDVYTMARFKPEEAGH